MLLSRPQHGCQLHTAARPARLPPMEVLGVLLCSSSENKTPRGKGGQTHASSNCLKGNCRKQWSRSRTTCSFLCPPCARGLSSISVRKGCPSPRGTDKEANSHKPPGKNRRKGQGGCRWSPIAFSDTDLPQTGRQEPNAISYSWLAEATYIATVSFILRF